MRRAAAIVGVPRRAARGRHRRSAPARSCCSALATWVGALARAAAPSRRLLRAQALVVVVVATCAEFIGSIVWGVYTYRLENLPSFVPPAHGLVYLAGASLAAAAGNGMSRRRARRARARPRRRLGHRRGDVAAARGRRRRARRRAARDLPPTRPRAARLRRRLPRGRLARALRHGDRHLGVGAGRSRAPRSRRQPAERRRDAATSGSTSSRWRSRRGCSRPALEQRVTKSSVRIEPPPVDVPSNEAVHSESSSFASAGSEKPILCSGSAAPIVSWRIAPSGTISSCGSSSGPCGQNVTNP